MTTWTTSIDVAVVGARLDADVTVPHDARAMVLACYAAAADGPPARMLAETLQRHHEACVLLDLAGGGAGSGGGGAGADGTAAVSLPTGELADRLVGAVDWLGTREQLRGLPLGLLALGAATPAALLAAAARPHVVRVVACVGGTADPAGPALPQVAAPTLMVVAEHDDAVREADQQARNSMTAGAELRVVAGVSDLTGDPGTLLRVVDEVGGWLVDQLRRRTGPG